MNYNEGENQDESKFVSGQRMQFINEKKKRKKKTQDWITFLFFLSFWSLMKWVIRKNWILNSNWVELDVNWSWGLNLHQIETELKRITKSKKIKITKNYSKN